MDFEVKGPDERMREAESTEIEVVHHSIRRKAGEPLGHNERNIALEAVMDLGNKVLVGGRICMTGHSDMRGNNYLMHNTFIVRD